MSDPSAEAGTTQPEEALAAAPEGGEVALSTDATAVVTEAAPAAATEPAPAAPAAPAPSAPAAAEEDGTRPNRRKVREGLVVSNSMDKTAVVAVIERVRHPRYDRTVQRTKRLYVHVEANDVKVGDRVRVAETRPLSKLKHWRLLEVLERAK
ncbi:MAG: 30S ribosomal protein S17 [Acidimicrobiales bacterium]